jgi:hypothetical protein
MNKGCCMVTFYSTHDALQAERIAKRAGIHVRMLPVPRWISADCTMGMESSMEQKDLLMTKLEAGHIDCNFVTWSDEKMHDG